MAHERVRHVTGVFKKLLGFSPLVGLFGHRQVGKSTFLAAMSTNYRTLDDVDTLKEAINNPKAFIRSTRSTPMVIDECQLAPPLFPTLKEFVRIHKRPGQFVLSGSVRFTSRLSVRESLAGRIAMLELLPFSVKEIMHEPLSDIIPNLMLHQKFSQDSLRCLNPTRKLPTYTKHFSQYLDNGGLPGLCFIRNPQLQKNALNDLHDLILTRDLALVCKTRTPLQTLKSLLSYIASNGFEPYNVSEVSRVVGLAPQTQKLLLNAMESMFLIRRIPIPLRKKDCFLLEDQLEEKLFDSESLNITKKIETAIYRNIRSQFYYRLDKGTCFETYLTRDNARVPIVVRDGERTMGIIVLKEDGPSLSNIRSGASFLKTYSNAKIVYITLSQIDPKILDDRSLLCAVSAIL